MENSVTNKSTSLVEVMVVRKRPLFELLVGLVGIFGYLWLVYPLYHLWIKVVVAVLLFVLLVLSNILYVAHGNDTGLQWRNWFSSGKILLPFTIVTIPIFYGVWQIFFPVNHNFYADIKFWQRILIYPIWALFQQYIVLGFFFRRYREIFAPHTNLAIFFSASTFSLMHVPAPSLLILCFVSGLVWAATFNKYPNLYSIAISHAILGAFCLQVLWIYGTVGPDADIGRWSKKQPPVIRGEISSINSVEITQKRQLIPINFKEQDFTVNGWIATMKPVEKIYLEFGKKLYPVTTSDKTENIAKRYTNSRYEIIAYYCVLPLEKSTTGIHPVSLKIYLQDALLPRSPGAQRWIQILQE